MTPERWRRVGELFHEALDLAPGERTAWVDRSCAADPDVRREVISLLDSDRAAGQGFVQNRVKAAVVSFYEGGAGKGAVERVGPYRLVRELGRGGMGTVHLAERDDEQYHTQVAIKLVRAGMDTDFILHRFRRERQILAHLQHPNIARLLDGGATEDGRPYIVMEYIDGVRITDYCQSHALGVNQRLTLFLDVCAAVEHAHRQFVVHRDIKPGNILVDNSGSAKLLDFGICKLLADPVAGGETMTSDMRMLTPDYASPEQIRGDAIATASDVYSLAAVLYELVTGSKPHRIENYTLREIEQAICEREVIRPSLAVSSKGLARRIRGDLDNILLLALQKDPRRRYGSVEQFAEDLRRFLAHQPVKARPDTVAYRVMKFARRRRGAVAAVTAVIVSLAGGVVVSQREARTARENLMQVRRLANAFVFDVHDAVRDLPGSTRARKLIVETGQRYLDSLASNARGNWELQSELAAAYRRIGDVQGNVMDANLGDTTAALESYRKAAALLDSVLRHDPGAIAAQLDRLLIHKRIGGIHSYLGDRQKALASYREAKRMGDTLLSRNVADLEIRRQLAEIHVRAGDILRFAGDYTASLQENSMALALLLETSAAHPNDRALRQSLATAYSAVGMNEIRLGRLKEGLERYRRALAHMEQLTRLEPANSSYQHDLMLAHSHVGDVLGNPNLHNLGDTAGAVAAYRQMLGVARTLYEADPVDQRALSDYAIALTRLAGVLSDDALPEKISDLRRSIELLREVMRVNPGNASNKADLGHGYRQLGDALMSAGDRTAAIQSWQESVALSEALLSTGTTTPVLTLARVRLALGEEAARQGNRETALDHARRVLDLCDPAGPSAKGRADGLQRFLTPRGSGVMGLVYARLAAATKLREDRDQALHWLEKSLSAWREVQSHPSFAPAHRKEMESVEAALAEMRKI